jgi:hypothetical protein
MMCLPLLPRRQSATRRYDAGEDATVMPVATSR